MSGIRQVANIVHHNIGVGGKSYKDIPWSLDKTYHFAYRKQIHSDGRIQLTAYFLDPAVGSWELIASMEVQHLGPDNKIYGFLEQWTGREPEKKRRGL